MDLAEAGIAGAEVVEGDAATQFAKAADGALGLGQVLDGGGFGDFQVEAGRVEAAVLDQFDDLLGGLFRAAVVGGEVEGQADARGPAHGRVQGLAQQGQGEAIDHADALGGGDEITRRDVAQLRAFPARQGLEGDGLLAVDVHDGLEDHVELALQVGPAQGLFGQAFTIELLAMGGAEQAGRAGAVALALVQGVVGVFIDVCGGKGLVGKGRDAQRAPDLDGHVHQQEGLAQAGADLFAKRPQLLVVQDPGDDQAEFVAAQAGQVDVLVEQSAQALADLIEQPVAHAMAIDVVDRLEAVQVDQAHGETGPLGARIRQQGIEAGKELPAVGEAGQAVLVGELEIFLAELGCLRLHVHQAGEVAVLRLEDDEHGDGHQQDVDRRGHEGADGGGGEEHHEGGVDHGGGGQGRGQQVHHAEDAADHGDRHVEAHMRLGIAVAIGKQRQRPGGEGRGHDGREHVGALQGRQHLRRTARPIARADPFRRPDHAEQGHDQRAIQRQPAWRDGIVGAGQHQGVGQQDEVHHRQLARQREVLRLDQAGIVLGHGHQDAHAEQDSLHRAML